MCAAPLTRHGASLRIKTHSQFVLQGHLPLPAAEEGRLRIPQWLVGLVVLAALPGSAFAGDAADQPDLHSFKQHIAACVFCHGEQGRGDAKRGYPRLADLHADYLFEQLRAYQSAKRQNPTMVHMVKDLPAAYLHKMADYFAAQDVQYVPPARVMPRASQGHRIVVQGTGKVPACTRCHGADLRGNAQGVPAIAGQHAKYLKAQLNAFADQVRLTGDNAEKMFRVHTLSASQIGAVVDYLATRTPEQVHDPAQEPKP